MLNSTLYLNIIPHIPDIDKGDNITDILISALNKSSICLKEFDVICIAHKIFSKAEGCIINLKEISPSRKAIELGESLNKDPGKSKSYYKKVIILFALLKERNKMKELSFVSINLDLSALMQGLTSLI